MTSLSLNEPCAMALQDKPTQERNSRIVTSVGLSLLWPQGSLSWNCTADALMFGIGIPSLTACNEPQVQLRHPIRSCDVAFQHVA